MEFVTLTLSSAIFNFFHLFLWIQVTIWCHFFIPYNFSSSNLLCAIIIKYIKKNKKNKYILTVQIQSINIKFYTIIF